MHGRSGKFMLRLGLSGTVAIGGKLGTGLVSLRPISKVTLDGLNRFEGVTLPPTLYIRGSLKGFTQHRGIHFAPLSTMIDEDNRRSLRTLVVDDNPVNRKVAEMLLRRLGHHTATASSGSEALDLLSSSQFDVILMDIQMPEMDGIEVTRQIRLRHSSLAMKIIAVTADGDRQACLQAGMDDHLFKPVTLERLRVALARHER